MTRTQPSEDASEVIAAFWESHPQFREPEGSYRQNKLPCDVRCAFVDFVDSLSKDGRITEDLADNITLDS